jgi:probable selenium-dependent hydroxylase accessory protein YqeC
MRFSFLDPWHLFLPREPGHVVALCGSGGKTTLLRAIAGVWAEQGLPVTATTTTRSEPVEGFLPLEMDSTATVVSPPEALQVYRHGGLRPDGKWEGLTAAAVDALEVSGGGEAASARRLVVVEVDGAAKHPFKYYRAGEPVWPARTSLAIVVMGVGGVGERAGAVVHRLGRAGVSDPVGVGPDAVWQWDHVHALLAGPGGYLDQVPDGVPVVLALAGLEQQPDSVGLFEFTGRAMAHPRVPLVLFCSRLEDGLSLRAAWRDEEDADDEPADA